MRTRDSIHRKKSPFYGPEQFTYQPESNSYGCPAGQQLNYGGRNLRNRTYAYIGTRKRCGACVLKAQCTSGAFRFLANWTWMSGSEIGNGIGSYGTLGTASALNLASSRVGAVPWIDGSGNLWFFGGLGKDPTDANTSGNLNDLWRFTP